MTRNPPFPNWKNQNYQFFSKLFSSETVSYCRKRSVGLAKRSFRLKTLIELKVHFDQMKILFEKVVHCQKTVSFSQSLRKLISFTRSKIDQRGHSPAQKKVFFFRKLQSAKNHGTFLEKNFRLLFQFFFGEFIGESHSTEKV